jgi:N-acetylmuramoyl-L-alanine amidase-like protein
MQIDKTTYNKSQITPYNRNNESNGYQPRYTGGPKSILIHTTNGNVGSTLEAEANYIARSMVIAAHYFIGKKGEIIEFLDPVKYIAYHAGCVNDPLFGNVNAVGIEMHNTPAEGECTTDQLSALDWLVRTILLPTYKIPYRNIERHRTVAVYCGTTKTGRKIDPSGFSDEKFIIWRNSLAGLMRFRVINPSNVYIRQSPQVNATNIAGHLLYKDEFVSDVLKTDELGETHPGTAGYSNQWAHILHGVSQGKPMDGLGFVSLSNLQRLE